MSILNWINKVFHPPPPPVTACNGPVIFLDTDILTDADIERIKQRMTPAFVLFSGHKMRNLQTDVRQAVIQG